MNDRTRPHQFPMPAPDAEIISWKCRACGEWVSEHGGGERTDCPIDWRRQSLGARLLEAVDVVRGR